MFRMIKLVTLAVGLTLMSIGSSTPFSPVNEVNRHRKLNGAKPVKLDVAWSKHIQPWCNHMMNVNSISHQKGILYGGSMLTTENVGSGANEANIFEAFKKSPGHNANLLMRTVTRFAHCKSVSDSGVVYVTYRFRTEPVNRIKR